MNKIYYNGFEITYKQEKQKDVNKLLQLIKADPVLMKQLLPNRINLCYQEKPDEKIVYINKKESEESIYIPDIDFYIDSMLEKLYNSFHQSKDYSMDELYYNAILLKNDKNNFYPKKFKTEEELYLITAAKYYNNKEEYKEYMLSKDPKETEKIYHWMGNQSRKKIYNAFLKDYGKDIGRMDSEILKVLEICGEEIDQINKEYFQDREIFRGSKPKLEHNLTIENLDLLFKKYLVSIDETGDWANEYTSAKRDNLIEIRMKENSSDKSGILYGKMKVYCDGTIEDLPKLAHQFGHYISTKSGKENIALSEFPSIFYEEEAYRFLIKEGYNQEEVNGLRNYHKKNLLEKFVNSMPIMRQIIIQKNMNSNITDFETLFNLDEEATNDCIDDYTSRIITEHDNLIGDSLSMIGDLLTHKVKEEKSKKRFKVMKKITEDLGNLTLEDTFDIINKTDEKTNI